MLPRVFKGTREYDKLNSHARTSSTFSKNSKTIVTYKPERYTKVDQMLALKYPAMPSLIIIANWLKLTKVWYRRSLLLTFDLRCSRELNGLTRPLLPPFKGALRGGTLIQRLFGKSALNEGYESLRTWRNLHRGKFTPFEPKIFLSWFKNFKRR